MSYIKFQNTNFPTCCIRSVCGKCGLGNVYSSDKVK